MIAGINPWASMWTEPRMTIRAIVHTNPKYGFGILATLYAVATLFYTANFYSWGLSDTFLSLFIPLLISAPLSGVVWFYFESWILKFTGLLLKGHAPIWHIRACLAWSKIPFVLSILMWFILLSTNRENAFIHYLTGISALFINFIVLILNIWAAILLIQAIREVQSFSLGRSILNVFLSWLLSSVILLMLMFVGRYIFVYIY